MIMMMNIRQNAAGSGDSESDSNDAYTLGKVADSGSSRVEDMIISIIGAVGIIGIIAATATGCYLCHKKKSHHPYKKAPAHSVDFTMAECDVEDSMGGRASIVTAHADGYGQVTMDIDDEEEEQGLVEDDVAIQMVVQE